MNKKLDTLKKAELITIGTGLAVAVGGMGVGYAKNNEKIHRKSFGAGLLLMSSVLVIEGIRAIAGK